MIWIVKDNEEGRMLRFSYPSKNPNKALLAYLTYLDPTSPQGDAIPDFNGEIWAEKDIENIGPLYPNTEEGRLKGLKKLIGREGG